jgi:hypothetical protein
MLWFLIIIAKNNGSDKMAFLTHNTAT